MSSGLESYRTFFDEGMTMLLQTANNDMSVIGSLSCRIFAHVHAICLGS